MHVAWNFQAEQTPANSSASPLGFITLVCVGRIAYNDCTVVKLKGAISINYPI